VRKHPIMATLPASRIVLAVLGFNAMGDASRDILDPRMLNKISGGRTA
jgi:ABC-type dipeptide/oligopeptide/nickel transport system permease subunit